MSDFSLALNDEQTTIRDWVHGFALDVMRPVAHEWDEREETPWPVIEEAAQIGIYSLDFFANAFADPTGLTMVLALEELAWGDAGLCMAIIGSTLAVAAIMANGTPEQVGEWAPAVLRHTGRHQDRRLRRERARRRFRRLLATHARRLRRSHRRMGAQRH